MRRRLFLTSGSAAFALALTGCGGGGGGSTAAATGSSPLSTTTADLGATDALGTSAPLQPQSAGGSGYPFGSRLQKYAAGVLPSQSPASMDALLTKHYDAWKAARVVSAESVTPGGLAIQFSDTNYLAVSEGMGYGMLIAVVFAGHDPKAQQLFDGLLAVVRARPSYGIVTAGEPGGKYLMDWRIASDGRSAGEGWNAMDGDLDIALALLMAHRQWGSSGKWNYLEEGKNTINAMKRWNMKDDGTTKGLRLSHVSRTSDYMFGHFRAFAAATGDKFWDKAVDRCQKLAERMQDVFSPGVGLLPDFVMNTDGEPQPSTGYVGDGNDKEGYFWWNACRNPWRFGTDYLLHGDRKTLAITQKMIDFFHRSSGGDPTNIGTGYALDGRQLTGGNSAAYHGPICVGACTDARYQSFVDAMWNWNAKNLTTGYYDSEIQLLSLVVASGNWWTTA